MHKILPILGILVGNNNIQYLMVLNVLKENLLALKWAHFGPNWALKRVLVNYLNFGFFNMLNIAYSDYLRYFSITNQGY